LRGVAKPS